MQIEISENEAGILKEIIASNLAGLKTEIHRTDTSDFKKALVEKRELLTKIFEKL